LAPLRRSSQSPVRAPPMRSSSHEPEPVEYVRVCDVYGAGFYYMPGTETCLKVSGYVRYDIGAGDLFGHTSVDKLDLVQDGINEDNDTWYKRARFQLRLDARSETELGTLRACGAFDFQYDTNQDSQTFFEGTARETTVNFVSAENEFSVEHAYLELGGFRAGVTDSLFSTFTNYAGNVIHDDEISYGPFETHQLAYTFNAGNGFTAAIALEEGSGDDDVNVDLGNDGVLDEVSADIYTLDSYIPHVVAGVGYTAGWGGVSVVAGYDSVWEQAAVKGRVDAKFNDAFSAFVMAGWKGSDEFDTNGDGVIDVSGLNYFGGWGGDWAIWGGATWQVNPKAAINVQLSYDDFEDFVAVANVAYELVPGFTITPEVAYEDNFNSDVVDDGGEWGGFLRLQRATSNAPGRMI
jgi:Porin subfamily